jgi:hypothetical protein
MTGASGVISLTTGGGCVRGTILGGLTEGGGAACVGGGDVGGGVCSATSFTSNPSAVWSCY